MLSFTFAMSVPSEDFFSTCVLKPQAHDGMVQAWGYRYTGVMGHIQTENEI